MNDLRDIARLYDLHEVLKLDPAKHNYLCPFPDHPHRSFTPSFGIYRARDGRLRFHCFGACGRTGDVIDAVGYLHIPFYEKENPDHVLRAAGMLSRSYEASFDIARPAREEPGIAQSLYRSYLPPGLEAVEYARRRGLDRATLQKFDVGQEDHWLSIPAFESCTLMGIKMRNLVPGKRYRSIAGSRASLFNHDAAVFSDDPVLVVKGEIVAMLLNQHGFLAVAPTGGESQRIKDYKHVFSFSSRVVVVGDNDRSPETRRKMQAFALQRAEELEGVPVFPPEQYKDLDEFILAEPQAALALVRSWVG